MTIIINQTIELISRSHIVSIGGLGIFSVHLAELSADRVVDRKFFNKVFLRAEMVNICIINVPSLLVIW